MTPFVINSRPVKTRYYRQRPPHPFTRLDPDRIRAIRHDTRVTREVAEDYGVCATTIWNIRAGRRWKWVTED